MTCYRLDGKRLAETGLPARLTAVCPSTDASAVDGTLEARETVKLVVEGMDAYAKVMELRAGGEVVVAFTDVSPDLKRWLAAKVGGA